jgi:hypothetical protein
VQQIGVVPDNNAVYPRYSPDGRRIAFMRASITEPLCLLAIAPHAAQLAGTYADQPEIVDLEAL